MQITNSVVCGASNGCIYKQIKPLLVGEHAFPLPGFVCMAAHVTICKFTENITMLLYDTFIYLLCLSQLGLTLLSFYSCLFYCLSC